MVYVPAGVPTGIAICPVVVLTVGTGPPFMATAGVTTVKFTWPIVTGTPFKVSGPFPLEVNTLPALGFPVVPFPPEMVSFTALITGAGHVIVTIAVSQFVGAAFSQIWYVMVYVPAGVPAGTEICPVAGLTLGTGPPLIEAAGVTTVRFTWLIVTATPPNVSGPLPFEVNTLPTFVFPVVPLIDPMLSLIASINLHFEMVKGKEHPVVFGGNA